MISSKSNLFFLEVVDLLFHLCDLSIHLLHALKQLVFRHQIRWLIYSCFLLSTMCFRSYMQLKENHFNEYSCCNTPKTRLVWHQSKGQQFVVLGQFFKDVLGNALGCCTMFHCSSFQYQRQNAQIILHEQFNLPMLSCVKFNVEMNTGM